MPPERNDSLLSIENIAAGYKAVKVLHDVSINVRTGSITALLGSNGVGKTTLMRVVAGLLAPFAGSVSFRGEDMTRSAPHKRVDDGIALVPEGRQVFADFTVAENLRLGAFVPRARRASSERLAEMFDLFPRLAERRNQAAGSLSGGEQQMLAIARGLMSSPTLLLLDEPSIGLSPAMTLMLFDLIRTVHATGVTVFIVEQNVRTTLAIADYAYVIEQGAVAIEGASAEVASNAAVRTAYLGL